MTPPDSQPKALRKPRALRPGDRVGVIAPASPVRAEFLEAGELRLRNLGFEPIRGDHLLDRHRYTAGTVQNRAADLRRFLEAPDIRAIWVARGGYGCAHLVPLLDGIDLGADPKPIIGASDATALLLYGLRRGVVGLHGPMPAQELARDRFDGDELRHHLMSTEPYGTIPASFTTLHSGRASGRVTGGCLSLVVASLGTSWEVDTRNAILLLEDTQTKPYQIDRMLTQLRQAGKLGQACGLIFGEMPGCVQTADQGYVLDDVLRDLTADLSLPVVTGAPFGHTVGVHRALPFGVELELDTAAGTVRLLDAMVS